MKGKSKGKLVRPHSKSMSATNQSWVYKYEIYVIIYELVKTCFDKAKSV